MKIEGKSLQVFWAEDDIEDRNLIRQAFTTDLNGIELVLFKNGGELLDALEDASFLDKLPNLIVADLNMPDFDGRFVLRRVSTHTDFKKIPLVIFSGANNKMDMLYLNLYNAKCYSKPAKTTDYNNSIREIINNHLLLTPQERSKK